MATTETTRGRRDDKRRSSQANEGKREDARGDTAKGEDVLQLLRTDHEEVRGLLEELSETTARGEKTRAKLFERIALMLEVHTRIEEEIVYPAYRDEVAKESDLKLYHEAVEEHRAAKHVLEDLASTPVMTAEFGGRAKVLKELVTHHADEEEEELFPKMKKLFDIGARRALGAKVAARKAELEEELEGALTATTEDAPRGADRTASSTGSAGSNGSSGTKRTAGGGDQGATAKRAARDGATTEAYANDSARRGGAGADRAAERGDFDDEGEDDETDA